MRREGRFILVLVWAGAAFVGGVSVFLFNNPPPLPGLWAGVVYALVLLVLAGFAYRVGRRDIGIGLLIGYAVLSLASGGAHSLSCPYSRATR